MTDDPTQGAQGKTGGTGGPGEQGERGRRGDIGRVGDTGKTGDTGQSGATGAQGQKGATGAAGPAGDSGPKGPDGERFEVDTHAVVRETIEVTAKTRERRVAKRAFLGGLIAACLIMIPVSVVISEQQVKDRAKVSELEGVVAIQRQIIIDLRQFAATNRAEIRRNCRRFRQLADINRKDAEREQAASDRFLASGDTFGLTPERLAKLIRESRERDRKLTADYRKLAEIDCAVLTSPGT